MTDPLKHCMSSTSGGEPGPEGFKNPDGGQWPPNADSWWGKGVGERPFVGGATVGVPAELGGLTR